MNFLPGQFVIVTPGALVRRVGSHEEHYVEKIQFCMILTESHMWHEPGLGPDQRFYVDYAVLFSDDKRVYYVSAEHIKQPDHIKDPARLFQRLKP